jgi:Secretion system C-terminal sorting domain
LYINQKKNIMKKLLLSLIFIASFGVSKAQNIYSYGFNSPTATMLGADGWMQTNQSSPVGASTYTVPTVASTVFTTGGQAGGPLSFTLINFNSTTGAGEISNWLISPVVSLQNGDVISFYTRTNTPNANPTPANTFPDRLELRLGTNGSFTANPSTGVADLGDFTTLGVTVNPDLLLTGAGSYPGVWTKYSYTVSGLTGITDCKVAFRYWVTDGGPLGANSNIIAIDTLSVDRTPLATNNFFAQNFKVYPNPATNVVNVVAKSGTTINQVEVTDINGRVVKAVTPKALTSEINITELTSGVYFVKVASDLGSGTTKIVKQ